MMSIKVMFLLSITLLINVIRINGHGRLLDPPARTSAWRFYKSGFPTNYDDNQMFCGGVDAQYRINKGKCGICGERFDQPKLWEKGGINYRGNIVATYKPGQKITTRVEITANHFGWFEFRVCNVDKLRGGEATQECLDQNVLKTDDGDSQYYLNTDRTGLYFVNLRLPSDLACDHCVLQWRYHTGNSWGYDRVKQKGCIGCGDQEEFYGCSDISISSNNKREWIDELSPPNESNENNKEESPTADDEVLVPKSLLYKILEEVRKLKAIQDRREQYDVDTKKRFFSGDDNSEIKEGHNYKYAGLHSSSETNYRPSHKRLENLFYPYTK